MLPELFELFAQLLELPFVDLELINKLVESDLLFGDFVLVQGFVLQKSMAEVLLAIFLILGLLLVDFQRDDWQRPLFIDLWLITLPLEGLFLLERSGFLHLRLAITGVLVRLLIFDCSSRTDDLLVEPVTLCIPFILE